MTTIEKLPAQFRRNAVAADNQGLHEVAEHLRYAAREVEQAEKPEPATIEDKTIELGEVLAWADGIRGALGTEQASKVEELEARIAYAITLAQSEGVDSRCPDLARAHAWTIRTTLEAIDNRCMEGDGPVRHTLYEARDVELRRIYNAAKAITELVPAPPEDDDRKRCAHCGARARHPRDECCRQCWCTIFTEPSAPTSEPPSRHAPRVNMEWPGAGEALAMTEAAVAAQTADMATDATCECGERPRELFAIEHSDTGHREWKLASHCTKCLERQAAPASEEQIDNGAVDDFTHDMKHKLSKAREKGRSGWHDPMQCSGTRLAEMLVEHARKANPGNYVDIANLAMMLHHRREPAELVALAFENAAPRAISSELQEIVEELQRTRQKFPGWPKDPIHAAQIVQEEAGELGRAVLQIAYEGGKATPSDARREAVQTAAVAIRFLEHFAAYSKAPAELVYYDR